QYATLPDATLPELHIVAKNSANVTTVNYHDSFAKLNASSIVVTAPTEDGTTYGADGVALLNLNAIMATGSFNPYQESNVIQRGEFSYQLSAADRFNYIKDQNSLVGPFTADINLAVTQVADSDLVAGINLPIIEPSGAKIRFGRAVLKNAFGPDKQNLAMPFELQYWDGTRFALNILDNTLDNCSSGFTAALALPLSIPTSVISVSDVSGGLGNVLLSAPNPNQMGDIKVTLEVDDWLKSIGLLNPTGTATFGRYRGNDRVIYWREVKN
ncbi:MAG: hypothetical protein HRU22_07830, partial [Gammaproteobacteria bacterium]|nr:hypothetical protein [Gammaproteobacteria bacterium]